ncbi:MAG: hypothetical protein AABW54_03025 [Candidatus Micrarchaeota archaeon]
MLLERACQRIVLAADDCPRRLWRSRNPLGQARIHLPSNFFKRPALPFARTLNRRVRKYLEGARCRYSELFRVFGEEFFNRLRGEGVRRFDERGRHARVVRLTKLRMVFKHRLNELFASHRAVVFAQCAFAPLVQPVQHAVGIAKVAVEKRRVFQKLLQGFLGVLEVGLAVGAPPSVACR